MNGEQFDLIVIDEATEISPEVWNSLGFCKDCDEDCITMTDEQIGACQRYEASGRCIHS